VLAGASGLAQTAGTPAGSQSQSPQNARPAVLPATDSHQNSPALEQVRPDAVVITIHGFCPGGDPKSATCATSVTKEQFEHMISAMSVNTQLLNNPVAMRGFAESYVQSMALAEAAEKAGVDRQPDVEELMRIVRVRTLADAYRRYLQHKYSNPTNEEIEAYYKQNLARFDQVELDRIAIPRANPRLPKEAQADWQKKVQKLAAEISERAAKGEDMGKLQVEAYKALGVTPPLTTDLGAKRRGSLPAVLEQELFSLKSGEVGKLQSDAAAFTIYKVRSRTTLSLEQAKAEIVQQIQQKNFQTSIQEVVGGLHSDFHEQYFGSHTPPRGAHITSPAPPPNPPRQ
jgi:PPIC-type PPIASE domain